VTSDTKPFSELQVWDLRFMKGPVQIFETGH